MHRWTLTIAILLAGLFARAALGQQTAPTTQPESVAVAPATQPDAAAAPAAGETVFASQISFLLKRNLPESMRRTNRLQYERLSEAQRNVIRKEFVGILRNRQAELEKLIDRKRQLDQMSPKDQDRYREKARLIEQVLKELTPAELAALNSLAPVDRARELNRRIAQLKAKQARETSADKTRP